VWYNYNIVRKIFPLRLENRLIIAFVIVALSPLILSFLITTRWVSVRLEKEIEGRLEQAGKVVDNAVVEMEKKAYLIGKILLQEPGFKEALIAQDEEKVSSLLAKFKVEFPVDVILVMGGKSPIKGKRIIRIEMEDLKTLIAGAVIPVEVGGEIWGRIITGYILGDRFAHNLSQNVGLEVRIYQKVGEESALPLPDRWIRDVRVSQEAVRRVLLEHQSFYEPYGILKERPYALYLKPLVGEEGKILGMVILGFPRSYTFPVVWKRFLPFFLFLWFFIAAALGYVVAKGVVRPIKEFTKGARAIAEGDLDQFIPVRTKDEIGRLAQAFNLMAQQLKKMREVEEELRKSERLITLGEIAATIAHEIRNPLGIIKNSAQMLKKANLTEERKKELLFFIVEESERLNRVVNDFLQYARTPVPKKRNVELEGLMEKILNLLQGEFKKRGIQIIKNYQHPLSPVEVDPEQFQQMFLNLLLNSIQAMPEGGRIEIDLFSLNGRVNIILRDTGTGIPQEMLSKIFDPFFTTREGGTGLGLSIVSKIVEAHGGEIKVESEVGKGTTFHLIFPQE